MSAIDPDVRGAASHRNMVEHLTAPLAAGAVENPVPVDASGKAIVDWPSRHPLLLAAPLAPLGDERLRLEATVPGTATPVKLDWAPYSEAGAFLPVWFEPFDPAQTQTAAFSVQLALTDGQGKTIAPAQIAKLIELRLLEGITGQLIYLLGAEKQRLRRESRELSAMRLLSRARDHALDRHGADVAVPRFGDRLRFDGAAIVSETERESDGGYRRRLSIYHPTLLRSRPRLLELLNGPGMPADPNAGAIGELAAAIPPARRTSYQQRFDLVDRNNDFAVAIHIVAAGDPALRTNFFRFVRGAQLILPLAADDGVHAKRLLPRARAGQEERLRQTMRKLFDFTTIEPGPSPAFAPMLAAALVRAARCIAALGGPSPWSVLRAQRADRGSRYELGLGADLVKLSAAQLNAMRATHASLKAADAAFGQVTDPDPADPSAKPELQGLLQEMEPQSATADPDGRWLLEPCGLRTVHPLPKPSAAAPDAVYLSHFPVFGMTIAETASPPVAAMPVGGFTRVVAARWARQTEPGAVVTYEPTAGTITGWWWDNDRKLAELGRATGQRATWSHMAAGGFAPKAGGLLLYDRSKGEAQICLLGPGAITPLGPVIGGLRKTWSHVVAYSSGDLGYVSRLLFYDRETGEAEIRTTDGRGGLTLLKSHTGLGTNWTHVAALATSSPVSELLFYDARAGRAEVFSPGPQGTLTSTRAFDGLLKRASRLTTGYFGGDATGAGLLLYDTAGGACELYDHSGARLGGQTGMKRSLSEIAAGQFLDGEMSQLFAYARGSGRAELWSVADGWPPEIAAAAAGLPRVAAQRVEARYHAPGDPGSNVVLGAGLAAALAQYTAAGGAAWTALSDAQADAQWGQAAAQAAGAPALQVFRKVGLPAIEDPAPVVARLRALPTELLDTVRLAGAQAQAITSGADVDSAAAELRAIAGVLRAQRLTSLLPLVTGAGDVLLVVGAMPLPVAGINLFEQIGSAFRWYVVPLQGDGAEVRAAGPGTDVVPRGEGLFALVALGYARRGLADPYEFEVALPTGARLTFEQYEYLMNLLDHGHPAAVRVNTWAIRHEHVDLKGDGTVATLDPTISRTYRAFRRPRHRGETGVTLDD